ncbi:Protein of unknown function [Cotesia congregata]|uniref:Retropepsins domain-containing protein n=1 Tax=Cotesia congregata TaxID=51543 RepID=A0A8J2HCC0_COTCN|nr:Protein of unknown function [Cotesia congregata]
MTPQAKLARLYQNLRPEYRRYIKRTEFTNVPELLRLAGKFEQLVAQENGQPQTTVRVGDKRPFAKIELGGRDIHALMDTGATASIISPATWTFVQNNGLLTKYDPTPKQGLTLGSHVVQTTGTAWIVISESGRIYTLPFHIIPSYRNDMLLGVDNLSEMGYHLLRKQDTFECHTLDVKCDLETARREIKALLKLDEGTMEPLKISEFQEEVRRLEEVLKNDPHVPTATIIASHDVRRVRLARQRCEKMLELSGSASPDPRQWKGLDKPSEKSTREPKTKRLQRPKISIVENRILPGMIQIVPAPKPYDPTNPGFVWTRPRKQQPPTETVEEEARLLEEIQITTKPETIHSAVHSDLRDKQSPCQGKPLTITTAVTSTVASLPSWA